MSTVADSTTELSSGTSPASRISYGHALSFWSVLTGISCAGGLCLWVDIPVASFFRDGRTPKLVHEILDHAEVFGHAVGVVYILLTILILDAPRRNWTPALLLGSLGSGLAADLLKLAIFRTRPRSLPSLEVTVWQTFGPLWHGQFQSSGDSHSFPSAHTATATGFAVILSAMYPRGRWLFFTFAALVGLQRLESSAHFPSDVCAGAAVGFCLGHAALFLRRWWRGADAIKTVQ